MNPKALLLTSLLALVVLPSVVGPVAAAADPRMVSRKATASNVYLNDLTTFSPKYAVDNDPATRWATDYGVHQAWLEVDLGRLETFDGAVLREACGERVEQFELQARRGDTWTTLARAKTIGEELQLRFAPVTARVVRLNILKANEGPTIWELRLIPSEAASLRTTLNDLIETFGPRYPKGPGYWHRLEGLESQLKEAGGPSSPSARPVVESLKALRREVLLAHPLVDFDKLLFVRRITYNSSHIYTDHYDGSNTMGGNLCILSPVGPNGTVTELAPELRGGLFGRYDLSFDGKRVVFAYKRPGGGYRIWEIGIDGRGLRQLTQDEPDETQMIERFGHGYDDLDPCYLPDGRIMFTSTRSRRAVLCTHHFTVTTLHVMDADGRNLRCVSANTVNEFTPCVMDSGRVIYTRWEYVDKGCGDVQSLWSTRPDGSGSAHVYKNNVARPATLIDARCIPGSNRLVAIGAPHMPLAVGSVVLVDTHVTQLTPAAMTNLTPELGYPGHFGYPGGKMGHYKEPYPLSEKLFLVAYNPNAEHSSPTGYGIYLLDAFGNRELIYREPTFSCFQPIPLRPRQRPPTVPLLDRHAEADVGQTSLPDRGPEADVAETATLFMADVYDGLTGIERGRVKHLRVMEDVPKPWAPSWVSPGQGDTLGLQNPAVSLDGHFATKRVHGLVLVHADGSAYFRVPAGKALYFQVLDEDYMELQRMRTFVHLMPGEKRSCIGCHEPRPHTPRLRPASAAAFNNGPQDLVPQPGDTGPRMVHYPLDVQPVLDKHCVGCHRSEHPKGGLDLTGEPTTLFNRSYENLIRMKLVNHINVDPRDAYIPAEPPLTFGSHRSKLVERIQSGACPANLSQAELVKLVTWIDANAPYYGTYEGKKNLKWRGDPDFRPPPGGRR